MTKSSTHTLTTPASGASKSAPTTPQTSPRTDAKSPHHQHTQSAAGIPTAQEKSTPNTATFKTFLMDLMKGVRFAFYEAKTEKSNKTEIGKVVDLEEELKKDLPNNDYAIQPAIERLYKILDDAMNPTFGWKRTPEKFTDYLNEKMESGRHFPRLIALVLNEIAKKYLSADDVEKHNLGWLKNVKQPEMYLKHFSKEVQQTYAPHK